MSISIPSQYKSYVTHAAEALGLPEQIVAAQIELESSWNPKARSPAGAEGIAQFEPGTFAAYGPKGGDPYNVGDAFKAYEAYMGQLLKQQHGSIRNALAAYNAGPGNLSAGYTYANMIMQRAGVVPGAKAGKAGKNAAYDPNSGVNQAIGDATSGLLSFPKTIISFFQDATSAIEESAKFASAFFQPSTYVRIGAGVAGLMLLSLGIVVLGLAAAKE